MIGQVRPHGPEHYGFGRWAAVSILGTDGCVYAIAADDFRPEIKAGLVVRFDVDGKRAVNIAVVQR